MITGQDVLDRALRLLGYTNHNGDLENSVDAAVYKRGAAAVRQIFDDLKRVDSLGSDQHTLDEMADPIPLSAVTIDDIMPYGVAMLVAQNEGDGDNQALFSVLYGRKRASVPRAAKARRDILPRGGC